MNCESVIREISNYIDGDLELVVYALPGEEPDERTHVMPLFRERMVIAVGVGRKRPVRNAFDEKPRAAGAQKFPVRDDARVRSRPGFALNGRLRLNGAPRAAIT